MQQTSHGRDRRAPAVPRTPRSHKPSSSVDWKRWTVALIAYSNRWRSSLVCSFQGVHIRRALRLFTFSASLAAYAALFIEER
jgi:hypothetical protein